MAFRVVRQRREARRAAKMEEIFLERDKDMSGRITFEQLEEICRIYEVDLDDSVAKKYINDENNEVTKQEFIKIATDLKLLDFENRAPAPPTPNKLVNKPNLNTGPGGGVGLLCCWGGEVAEMDGSIDKIELAFRKLDTDGDGFLTWQEFQQIAEKMSPDQAERIFAACDQDLTGKITLDDFRMIAMSKPSKRDSTMGTPESV